MELEIVHPDGNNRWLNWIGGLVYDDSRKITGLHGTAQNITERKIMESQREAALEALRKSEEKYRWVLDNMADVIAVMDMDLRFTYAALPSCGCGDTLLKRPRRRPWNRS